VGGAGVVGAGVVGAGVGGAGVVGAGVVGAGVVGAGVVGAGVVGAGVVGAGGVGAGVVTAVEAIHFHGVFLYLGTNTHLPFFSCSLQSFRFVIVGQSTAGITASHFHDVFLHLLVNRHLPNAARSLHFFCFVILAQSIDLSVQLESLLKQHVPPTYVHWWEFLSHSPLIPSKSVQGILTFDLH